MTGEEDPFANLDVTVDEELDNRVKQVAPGSEISTYLESEKKTCLESDNKLPTRYSLPTEQQLLEAIGTSHNVMEIESDDGNGMEKEDTPGESACSNEITALKSFKHVLDRKQTIFVFFIHSLRLLMNLVSLATKWGKLQFKGEVHRADWNDILRQCDS